MRQVRGRCVPHSGYRHRIPWAEGLSRRHLVSGPRGWKFKVKASAGLVPPEVSVLGV